MIPKKKRDEEPGQGPKPAAELPGARTLQEVLAEALAHFPGKDVVPADERQILAAIVEKISLNPEAERRLSEHNTHVEEVEQRHREYADALSERANLGRLQRWLSRSQKKPVEAVPARYDIDLVKQLTSEVGRYYASRYYPGSIHRASSVGKKINKGIVERVGATDPLFGRGFANIDRMPIGNPSYEFRDLKAGPGDFLPYDDYDELIGMVIEKIGQGEIEYFFSLILLLQHDPTLKDGDFDDFIDNYREGNYRFGPLAMDILNRYITPAMREKFPEQVAKLDDKLKNGVSVFDAVSEVPLFHNAMVYVDELGYQTADLPETIEAFAERKRREKMYRGLDKGKKKRWWERK